MEKPKLKEHVEGIRGGSAYYSPRVGDNVTVRLGIRQAEHLREALKEGKGIHFSVDKNDYLRVKW